MHKLVVIDLKSAEIGLFEDYERNIIPLLNKHGGRMELGFRSVDGKTETHVLYFPDIAAFENFLSDPVRLALKGDWKLTGALATVTDVNEIDYL